MLAMTAWDDVLCYFEQPDPSDHEHKDAEAVARIAQAESPSDQGNSGKTLEVHGQPCGWPPLDRP